MDDRLAEYSLIRPTGSVEQSVYRFNNDWFSGNIPNFQRFLSPLAGSGCRILEIGAHEGRSAVWMLENVLTHPMSRLVCVDRFEQENLSFNLAETGREGQVDFQCGYSREVLRELQPASFDFIYIDGRHHRVDVLEDGVFSFRLAKSGAVMCFDDYL